MPLQFRLRDAKGVGSSSNGGARERDAGGRSACEEILGRSIETPDHRVRLYLALRARELLDSRAASPV